jgi:hypothetical protein
VLEARRVAGASTDPVLVAANALEFLKPETLVTVTLLLTRLIVAT